MGIKSILVTIAMVFGPTIAYADTPAKTNCPQDCPMNCPQMGGGPMRGGPKGAGMMRGGGWNNGPYARVYDPKTVETIKGEVVQVDHMAPMSGMSEGVHVVLKTDNGTTDVHLGPAWYLDHQDTQVSVGDHIEVRGSKMNVAGKPAVVAAEVKKGNETLQLRDAQGLPMWRGWR